MNELRGRMEQTMRTYFDGCNEADIDKMMSCFVPGAAHYFPAGAPQGPFLGARAIAEGWVDAVETLGSIWTVDHIAIDAEQREAVMEWTHFKTKLGIYLRGDEWYRFNEDCLITEVRAYYAAPTAAEPQCHELGGFDYVRRGFPLDPPEITR